jgi:hypothetical protein
MSNGWWTLYIAAKHSCEVLVLTLELIISTAIKSYDTGRHPVRTPSNSGVPGPQTRQPVRTYQHRDIELSAADVGENTSLLAPRS